MDEFVKALVSDGRSPELPEEHDWFGKLVGSWRLDYLDRNLSSSVEGEWIFERVLEGMGIQDVIILPARDVRTETPHSPRRVRHLTARLQPGHACMGRRLRLRGEDLPARGAA